MKSSTKDNAQGQMHQVKGRFKQAVGVIFGNKKLEDEGKVEKTGGKTQEKAGQVKKVMDQ
ncbi:MAG: CsbD family protein [Thermodesulfobacteriota bacterium]